MTSQFYISREKLEPNQEACLLPAANIPFFPRTSFFVGGIISFVIYFLPLTIFIFHVIFSYLHGKTVAKDEVISASIVVLPLAFFAVFRLVREGRRKRLYKKGLNPLGVYFSNNFILWHHQEEALHVIDKSDLQSIELTSAYVHRAPHAPDKFKIILNNGEKLTIGDADDYEVGKLLAAFKSWQPKVEVFISSNLEAHKLIFLENQNNSNLFLAALERKPL